jgi:hypothetical protein
MSTEYTLISDQTPTSDIPLVGKIGGLAIGSVAILADVELDYLTSYFRVGDTAANKTLILEGADGNPVPFINLVTGEVFCFATKKILYQATIGATTYTTNALYVTWIGAK